MLMGVYSNTMCNKRDVFSGLECASPMKEDFPTVDSQKGGRVRNEK